MTARPSINLANPPGAMWRLIAYLTGVDSGDDLTSRRPSFLRAIGSLPRFSGTILGSGLGGRR
jgi:hypothetical protein